MDPKQILRKVQQLTKRVAEFNIKNNPSKKRLKHNTTLLNLVGRLQELVVLVETQASFIDEFKFQENIRQQKDSARINSLEERIAHLEKIIAGSNATGQTVIQECNFTSAEATLQTDIFCPEEINLLKVEPLDVYETSGVSVTNCQEVPKEIENCELQFVDNEEPARTNKDLPLICDVDSSAFQINLIEEDDKSTPFKEGEDPINYGIVAERDPLEINIETPKSLGFDDDQWDDIKSGSDRDLRSPTPPKLNTVKHNLMDVLKSMRRKVANHQILCGYEDCGLKFDTKVLLTRHERECHLGFIHNCPHCGNGFKRRSNLSQHMKVRHTKLYFEARKKEAEIKPTKNPRPTLPANPPLSIKHQNRPTKIPCLYPKCREIFSTEQSLIRHRKREHPTSLLRRKSSRGGQIICDAPGCNKTFTRKANIMRHYETGHPELCYNCNGEFSTQKEAMFHRKNCRVGKNYKCMVEWCPKLFATKTHALRHFQYLHSSSHRFKCNYCDLFYESRIECKNHMEKCRKNRSVLKSKYVRDENSMSVVTLPESPPPEKDSKQSVESAQPTLKPTKAVELIKPEKSIKRVEVTTAPEPRTFRSARLTARASRQSSANQSSGRSIAVPTYKQSLSQIVALDHAYFLSSEING